MNNKPGSEASLFLALEPICDAFESAWRSDSPPRLEDYLDRVGSEQQERLLRDLCSIEIEQRRSRGEDVTLAELVQRFPAYPDSLGYLAEEHPEWDLKPKAADSVETIRTVSPQEDTNVGRRSESTQTAGTIVGSAVLQPPSQNSFGDYELLEEIGQGGMGVIYKARQRKLNRIVAVKMIRAGQLATPSDIQRFQSEAEAIGQLEHPQIVPIYEVDEEDGIHFFSMAFVDGEDLAKKLLQGPLPQRQAAQLVYEIARAIHYAHQQGIIHRDLKPANILLTRDGQIRVTDFGLAKQQGAEQGPTVTGDIVGTPGYMSPEQATGLREAVGVSSDVYSLGAILYSLLTGRPPFQAATMVETLFQVVNDTPVAPRQVNPAVDRDLETICLKCLEKTDVRRYATAHDLSLELKRFLDGHPIQARPVGTLPRVWRWCCRRPKLAAAWSVVAGLLLFLGIAGPMAAIRQTHLKTVADQAAQKSRESAKQYRTEQLRADAEAATAIKQRQRADAEAATAIKQRQRANQQAAVATRQKLVATEQAAVAKQALYDTRMILAQSAWETAHMRSMRRLISLYRTPGKDEDYRGFEWYYLNEQSHQERFEIEPNRGFAIMDIVIRPGSREMATAGGGGRMRIWNTQTGKMIRQVALGSSRGSALDYSDDGKLLAIGCGSGELHFFEADTLKLTKKVKVGSVELEEIDLLPGASRCIVRNKQDAIISVQIDTGEITVIQEAVPRNKYLGRVNYEHRRFACSSDGKYLVFNDSNREVILWDLQKGVRQHQVRGTYGSNSSKIAPTLALTRGGRWLVHGDRRGEVSVWRPSDSFSLQRTHDHDGPITQLMLTPDERFIVSAGRDRTIQITEIGRQRRGRVFRGHETIVTHLAVAPNNEFLVSADGMGRLKVFSLTDPDNPRVHRVEDTEHGLAFHPTKAGYAIAQSKGTIGIWNGRSRQPVRKLTGHQGKVRFLTFHPQGEQLAAGLQDGKMCLWNPETGEYLREWKGHQSEILAMAYSPDGRRLASTAIDNQLKIWDVKAGKLVRSIPFAAYSKQLSWNADGTRVVSEVSKGQVWVVDVETGKTVLMIPGTKGIYSPDGKYIVCVSAENWRVLYVCDALTGKKIGELRGHLERIADIVITPDSQRVISLDIGKTIAVWNMRTKLQLASIPVGGNHVGGRLIIGPHGRTLAHLGIDATIWSTGKSDEQ